MSLGPTVPLNTQGVRLLIVDAVLAALASIWTALRFHSRRMHSYTFLPEDWMILGALVMYYGMAIASYLMVIVGGFTHHAADISLLSLTRCLQFSFAVQVFYAASLGLVKTSICIMFSRMFYNPVFKTAAVVGMTLAIAWAIMTILIGMLICQPVRMNWIPTTPGGKCGNQVAAFAAVGVVDVVLDCFIFLLPIPMVFKSHVRFAEKLGLICIFGVGIFIITVGAVRLGEIFKINFTDFTYSAILVHFMSMVEPAVAIIVACSIVSSPTLTLIFHVARSVLNSQRSQSSSHGLSHNISKGVSTKSFGVRVDELQLSGWDPKEYGVQTHIASSRSDGSDAGSSNYEHGNVIHVRTDIRQ